MKRVIQTVTGFKNFEVPYTLIMHERPLSQLAIFLPGEGYTNSRPLFHFAEDIFMNHKIDVLEVDYQYKEKAYDEFSMEEISEAVQFDVEKILDFVLGDTSYDQYYIVAKSIGSIGLSKAIHRHEFKHAKIIWLTPLLIREDVLEGVFFHLN